MKLPAVAIAAVFAGGILLGQSRVFCPGASVREDVLITLVVIGSVLILGLVDVAEFPLAWRNRRPALLGEPRNTGRTSNPTTAPS